MSDHNPDLRIAVISGGNSAEAEVSRSSARGVSATLRENYKSVFEIDLAPTMAGELADVEPDVVFPVLHGPPGEDGTIQGFLEMCGYAYVGSDVHGSAVAMDKVVAKSLFRIAGLPVIDQVVLNRGNDLAVMIDSIDRTLGQYVVIKPARQGSAIGVSLVDNANEMHEAITKGFEFDEQLLVEKRIDGKEITVGVLDTDDGTVPFPVIEIATPGDVFYDYEHRYTAGLSEHIMPARVAPEQLDELQRIAVTAHQCLGCRDLSRADFVVTADEICLLEVNTLPGMTPTSLYPDGANEYGLPFPALVSYLVERAAARG